MRTLRRFLIRLATFATGRRDDERFREEIEQHLAMQTAENIRAGLSPVEARRQAVLKFGAVEAITERYRDEQGVPSLEHLLQDVRFALRQLHKAPLFTLTATVSLAVGIGANNAVFTVVDRVLLKPLPVSRPQELVFLTDQRGRDEQSPRYSYPFYTVLRDNNVLTGTAAHFSLAMNAATDGHVARVRAELVSGNYFDVVGARTQIGRPLTPDDDRTPGAHAVALISDGFWRRSFGSDPSVLGRSVRLNDHLFTIVGVTAKGFTGTDVGLPTEIWIPMIMQREVGRNFLADAGTTWLEIVGRLPSGVNPERAGAELTSYFERRAGVMRPESPPRSLILLPGDKGNASVRRQLGPALRVLLALTTLALLLACVNVASLLVVRSVAREKEIAVRLALGAPRSSLIRQFLVETLVLAALGGTAGLLIAPWAAGLLVASQPGLLDIDASLDVRVFMFGLGAWMVTGLLVGLAPVLASSRVGLVQIFGRCSTPSGTPAHLRVRDAIVLCQIAVSLVMLIGAGLFVQTVRGLTSVDPGFRADNLLLISVDAAAGGYDGPRLEAFWRDTLDRVTRIRGVESASLAGTVPLAPGRQRMPLSNPTSGEMVEIDTTFVGPRYFRTLAIPVLAGREFDERDGKTSGPVAIVNERLARMFWPNVNPIGKGISIGRRDSPPAEIVGIVKDAKYRALKDEAAPMLYVPLFQTGTSDPMTLHVRGSDPTVIAGAIRREMQMLDRNVPLFGIRTLDDQLNASFAQTRQAALLTSGFGILALLLSAIGVYGVTALAVTRQTRDIGIRMAFGAQPRHIVPVIGRRGLTLVMAGLGLGLLGSFTFTRIAGTLLYGVTAGDVATFAGMSALLAVVSLIAIYIPVRMALRLDAVAAIRYE